MSLRNLGNLLALVSIFLVTHVFGQTDFDWGSVAASDNLTWVECYSSTIQCSRLSAPMNYSNPSAGSFSLALIRIPSPLTGTASYRGPVLFNPGGPGGSGVEAILGFGAQISKAVGPEFDVLSFDPRGIANSTPVISFFKTDVERAAFDFGPHATDPTATPDVLPSQWAHYQALGRLAKDRDTAGVLAHVSTDNVARDMLRIVQAHGQTKLQYWGISYGSVLGATFATLFPDKVERLLIDGVLDMGGYFAPDFANEIIDADKVLQAFFDECHKAGPTACAFYANSSAAISHKLDTLYQKVLAQPVPAYSPSLPQYGFVDHPTLKNAILVSFYQPYSSFSALAQGLALLENGDGSALYQLSTPRVAEPVLAIVCGDAAKVTDDAATLKKYVKSIEKISSFSSIVAGVRLVCSGWRVNPDNFKGPVGGVTSFPLLLIGNTADPVTAIAGAKKTAKQFPGSVVLTQDGLGHTSFASPSACTIGHIQAYFQNGTLPAVNTVCPVTEPLFPLPSTNSTQTPRELHQEISLAEVTVELRNSYRRVARGGFF
ncbi:hypothetical protein M413DRAFT_257941 [Hebeloma cylindrosporum]|uniref:Peptidase S33 tripeptidyl aminopeptidase-like C-terminal domain-containing protein n=1 Tax=Hebeloma cylindrosporum TaxID=76867 RepID=A0A0C2Y9A1_HEBCY|nr:hypothetical protein M413DRAFT_257941 [Hebeloma cylindrosporum h7]